jgi:hypothetical protein
MREGAVERIAYKRIEEGIASQNLNAIDGDGPRVPTCHEHFVGQQIASFGSDCRWWRADIDGEVGQIAAEVLGEGCGSEDSGE